MCGEEKAAEEKYSTFKYFYILKRGGTQSKEKWTRENISQMKEVSTEGGVLKGKFGDWWRQKPDGKCLRNK